MYTPLHPCSRVALPLSHTVSPRLPLLWSKQTLPYNCNYELASSSDAAKLKRWNGGRSPRKTEQHEVRQFKSLMRRVFATTSGLPHNVSGIVRGKTQSQSGSVWPLPEQNVIWLRQIASLIGFLALDWLIDWLIDRRRLINCASCKHIFHVFYFLSRVLKYYFCLRLSLSKRKSFTLFRPRSVLTEKTWWKQSEITSSLTIFWLQIRTVLNSYNWTKKDKDLK